MNSSTIATGLALAVTFSASAGTLATSTIPGAAAPSQSSRQLIRRFVDAYARQDSAALARTTTKSFRAEFELTQPMARVSITGGALGASWQAVHTVPTAYPSPTLVAIYPTTDAQSVFVTYRVPGQTGVERIALIELRGDRVARIEDYVSAAPGASETAQRTDVNLADATY